MCNARQLRGPSDSGPASVKASEPAVWTTIRIVPNTKITVPHTEDHSAVINHKVLRKVRALKFLTLSRTSSVVVVVE